MRARDLGMLVLLAALWGASFLFIRVAVHITGPVVLAFIRVVFAAAGLAIYAASRRQRLALRGHWRAFLILAFGNAALPYILISASELHLTASLAAILNATTPLFAAALGVVWLRSATIVLAILGLALLATSFAYILYFTLIASIGPTRTLGVTFLVPVFGLIWGALFLHEPIGPSTALGLLSILVSVLLTSGLRLGPRTLPHASIERPH